MEKDRWSQGNSAHLALPFCLGGNTFYEGLATAEEPLSGILGLKDRALVSRCLGMPMPALSPWIHGAAGA